MRKSNAHTSGIISHGTPSGISKYPSLYDTKEINSEIERFRQYIEDALSQTVANTPKRLRQEIWNNSEITDEKVFDQELEKARILLDFYWGYATMLLSEGKNEREFDRVLRIMRDKVLIIDATENSSKGPGELV